MIEEEKRDQALNVLYSAEEETSMARARSGVHPSFRIDYRFFEGETVNDQVSKRFLPRFESFRKRETGFSRVQW